MKQKQIESSADALFKALRTQIPVPALTESHSDITLEDAYHISQNLLQRRLASSNEKLIGKKIGVTSPAVQEMLSVFQPDFGFLTDAMMCEDGSEIVIKDNLIQPRAEGEIAFRLKSDLVGPGIKEADVLAATESIMACFEIVDSRIQDWQIKIEDTVADNASCGVFTLGKQEIDPRGLDLAGLKMKVYKNGNLHSEGKGSAVQGNPLTAVAWLANTLGRFGIKLEAGDVILSGSLVPLIPVVAGDHMRLELEIPERELILTSSCSFI